MVIWRLKKKILYCRLFTRSFPLNMKFHFLLGPKLHGVTVLVKGIAALTCTENVCSLHVVLTASACNFIFKLPTYYIGIIQIFALQFFKFF